MKSARGVGHGWRSQLPCSPIPYSASAVQTPSVARWEGRCVRAGRATSGVDTQRCHMLSVAACQSGNSAAARCGRLADSQSSRWNPQPRPQACKDACLDSCLTRRVQQEPCLAQKVRSLKHVNAHLDPCLHGAPPCGLAGRGRAFGKRPQMCTQLPHALLGPLAVSRDTRGQGTHEPGHACLRTWHQATSDAAKQ